MNKPRPTHEENCAVSRYIKKARVDGPTLRVQWLASGADQSPPGTFYKAEVNGPAKDARRVFHVFIPAPANNRATVKVALMNHLEGLTHNKAATRLEEITQ